MHHPGIYIYGFKSKGGSYPVLIWCLFINQNLYPLNPHILVYLCSRWRHGLAGACSRRVRFIRWWLIPHSCILNRMLYFTSYLCFLAPSLSLNRDLSMMSKAAFVFVLCLTLLPTGHSIGHKHWKVKAHTHSYQWSAALSKWCSAEISTNIFKWSNQIFK